MFAYLQPASSDLWNGCLRALRTAGSSSEWWDVRWALPCRSSAEIAKDRKVLRNVWFRRRIARGGGLPPIFAFVWKLIISPLIFWHSRRPFGARAVRSRGDKIGFGIRGFEIYPTHLPGHPFLKVAAPVCKKIDSGPWRGNEFFAQVGKSCKCKTFV